MHNGKHPQSCDVCGKPLVEVERPGFNPGWTCPDETCLSHFKTSRCKTCGEAAVKVKKLHEDEYELQCKNGHWWQLFT